MITAFVISAGTNPNYDLCLEALKRQTVPISIEIIKDYSPLSVAFQQMLDRCQTPYFVEVDEDMILDDDAIETMYQSMIKQDEKTAMVGYQLLDVHNGTIIFGVKIYNHSICKQYPYSLENISCEVDQLDRMKKDGYTYTLIEKVIGKHSPLWSNELIFERYLNLMEKFKEFKYMWLESIPKKLVEIFKKNPTEQNLYAILGAYTSIISEESLMKGEKNFSDKRQQCCKMQSFLEYPTSATLYVTNKCNFKCGFCLRQHKDLEDFPDMTVNVLDDLLFKLPTIKSFCICGAGEPFLCKNLKEMMQILKAPSLFIGLITNGSLLVEKLPEFKDCLPNYLSISLNAPDAITHKEITKSDSFDRVLDGIRMSVNMGISTYLSYVCTKENLTKVPDFLRLAKELGVKSVNLHNMLPHFSEEENAQFWDLVLTKKDQPWVDEIRQDKNSDMIGKYPVLISQDEIRRECQWPWKTIGVNGNGSITLCNSVDPPRKENGTIKDYVIWQNEYCQKFREMKAGEQRPTCKKCFRNWKWE